MSFDLALIEQQAAARDLLLRLQLGGAGPLQTLRVVVARRSSEQSLALLGELKGWATPQRQGLTNWRQWAAPPVDSFGGTFPSSDVPYIAPHATPLGSADSTGLRPPRHRALTSHQHFSFFMLSIVV